jgi:hypothetical protein
VNGQISDRSRYIQVSGFVFDADSNAVPNVNVISYKLRKGAISGPTGIYSVISSPGDTILFSAMGYKKIQLYIPLIVNERQFTKDIVLRNDTINITDVIILPWKNYEEFKREVLKDRPVKPEILNMYENLISIQTSILNSSNLKVSPDAGFRYAMEQNYYSLMTKNQFPVNNLLNPFAWAKFINSIKNGLFKNQKSQQSSYKYVKVKKKKETKD